MNTDDYRQLMKKLFREWRGLLVFVNTHTHIHTCTGRWQSEDVWARAKEAHLPDLSSVRICLAESDKDTSFPPWAADTAAPQFHHLNGISQQWQENQSPRALWNHQRTLEVQRHVRKAQRRLKQVNWQNPHAEWAKLEGRMERVWEAARRSSFWPSGGDDEI